MMSRPDVPEFLQDVFAGLMYEFTKKMSSSVPKNCLSSLQATTSSIEDFTSLTPLAISFFTSMHTPPCFWSRRVLLNALKLGYLTGCLISWRQMMGQCSKMAQN
jgi:hypothetical protein